VSAHQPGWERVTELAELGVLTASLLHELRQPLFGIKGRLQLARESGQSLDLVAVEEMLGLLVHAEALLDHYAGLGRSDDSWTDLDLRDVVGSATHLLAARASQLDVDLVVDVPDVPVIVSGRAVAMRQVALNLVQNALDAVAGSPRRRVHVALSVRGRSAALVVSDTGPGVPEALRGRLFEPFVTSKPAGTGLGLYIAQTLVDEAGGSLELDVTHGTGTTLTVRLPCAAPRAVAVGK
jgi:two-component system C4-dicarboxylate transport sensor histidine kinase DctB